jgi:hypothetical protein
LPRGTTGHKYRPALDGGPGKVQNGLFNPAFEASAPQYGKGNVAVNSQAHWRTLNSMSNPIFQILCFIRVSSVAKYAV